MGSPAAFSTHPFPSNTILRTPKLKSPGTNGTPFAFLFVHVSSHCNRDHESSPKKAKADDAEEQGGQSNELNKCGKLGESNTENGENKTAPEMICLPSESSRKLGGSSGWDSPAEAAQPTQCHQEAKRSDSVWQALGQFSYSPKLSDNSRVYSCFFITPKEPTATWKPFQLL